jgi:branched-chain amino acid aminotransferase
MKNPLIYHNFHWIRLKSSRISPLDRGFLYGDGVFETLRSYHGHFFKLNEHLQRLFYSASRIGLVIPKTPKAVEAILYKILSKNKLKDGIARITCSRGQGVLGLDPSSSFRPTFIIMAFPFIPHPETLYKKGLSISIVKTVHNIKEAVPNDIKSSNFLNHILAKIEAKQSGADEGILLNRNGYLTEGTSTNLFFIQKGRLFTPSLYSGILDGITRKCAIELAKKNDIPVIEKTFKKRDLEKADECFVTNTGFEIIPATKLNGNPIGSGIPGPITLRLMGLFKNYVSQSIPILHLSVSQRKTK